MLLMLLLLLLLPLQLEWRLATALVFANFQKLSFVSKSLIRLATLCQKLETWNFHTSWIALAVNIIYTILCISTVVNFCALLKIILIFILCCVNTPHKWQIHYVHHKSALWHSASHQFIFWKKENKAKIPAFATHRGHFEIAVTLTVLEVPSWKVLMPIFLMYATPHISPLQWTRLYP
jgi:hypothetical protein